MVVWLYAVEWSLFARCLCCWLRRSSRCWLFDGWMWFGCWLYVDANVDRSSYRNHKFYNEMKNMPFFTSLKKPFSNKHNILWVHRFWRIRLNNKWLPSWNTKTNWEASLPLCLLQLFWLAQRTLMAKLAPLEPFMLTSSENWSFEIYFLLDRIKISNLYKESIFIYHWILIL